MNQVLKCDTYLIPRIEDLFARIAEGQQFTTLDLNRAYQQLALDENSRKYVVINTHQGLFQYNRLPFWCFIGSWYLPKDDGNSVASNSRSSGLLR